MTNAEFFEQIVYDLLEAIHNSRCSRARLKKMTMAAHEIMKLRKEISDGENAKEDEPSAESQDVQPIGFS